VGSAAFIHPFGAAAERLVEAGDPASPARRNPLAKNKNARLIAARSSQKDDPSIETLRLALQRERGSFSNWSTEARPFARSSVVGSEVGA
jgi:hypothetical protein